MEEAIFNKINESKNSKFFIDFIDKKNKYLLYGDDKLIGELRIITSVKSMEKQSLICDINSSSEFLKSLNIKEPIVLYGTFQLVTNIKNKRISKFIKIYNEKKNSDEFINNGLNILMIQPSIALSAGMLNNGKLLNKEKMTKIINKKHNVFYSIYKPIRHWKRDLKYLKEIKKIVSERKFTDIFNKNFLFPDFNSFGETKYKTLNMSGEKTIENFNLLLEKFIDYTENIYIYYDYFRLNLSKFYSSNLNDYLKKYNPNFSERKKMIFSILTGLFSLHYHLNYTHNDLHFKNFLLDKNDSEKKIECLIGNYIYYIYSDYDIKIIDFTFIKEINYEEQGIKIIEETIYCIIELFSDSDDKFFNDIHDRLHSKNNSDFDSYKEFLIFFYSEMFDKFEFKKIKNEIQKN